MIAAAAMNFKRVITKWKVNPRVFLAQLFNCLFSLVKTTNPQIQNLLILKLSFKGRLNIVAREYWISE
jgi:hypothetical protein